MELCAALDAVPHVSRLRVHTRMPVVLPERVTPELIELGREIAAHYACPLGRTLKAITPEAVRRQRGLTTVRYASLKRSPEEILKQLREDRARENRQ